MCAVDPLALFPLEPERAPASPRSLDTAEDCATAADKYRPTRFSTTKSQRAVP